MSEALKSVPPGNGSKKFLAPLGFLSACRLQVYGFAIAGIYAAFFVWSFRAEVWIVDGKGLPIYTDFACAWAATLQALHGNAGLLYDSAEFVKAQAALVAPADYYYPNWPYPPTFFLLLAPFTVVRYLFGFLAWDILTLLGFIAVIYLIVRRLSALAVALAAAHQWRVFASASVTAAVLVGISIAVVGTGVWQALPHQLAAQTTEVFLAGGNLSSVADWGYIQTAYGLVRLLDGDGATAWLTQGLTTIAGAVIVWLVWRSPVRYSLKAAALSAAALVATPYAFAYDMVAIAIPEAFLARDQIRHGFLRAEQSIAISLFAVTFAVFMAFGDRQSGVTFGSVPLAPIVISTLLCVIVRRARRSTACA